MLWALTTQSLRNGSRTIKYVKAGDAASSGWAIRGRLEAQPSLMKHVEGINLPVPREIVGGLPTKCAVFYLLHYGGRSPLLSFPGGWDSAHDIMIWDTRTDKVSFPVGLGRHF